LCPLTMEMHSEKCTIAYTISRLCEHSRVCLHKPRWCRPIPQYALDAIKKLSKYKMYEAAVGIARQIVLQ
jgi:hypothetical protein